MTPEKFFESFIISDHEFLHELYNKYQTGFNHIAQKFNDTGKYSIEFDQMSIPNEVLDFLDGNGFYVHFENGKVIVSRPLRNANEELIPSTGWLGSTLTDHENLKPYKIFHTTTFYPPMDTAYKPIDATVQSAVIENLNKVLERLSVKTEPYGMTKIGK